MDLNEELRKLKFRIEEFKEYLDYVEQYPNDNAYSATYVPDLLKDVIGLFESLDKEIKRTGILPYDWGSLVSEAPVQLPNQKIKEPEHVLNVQ